MAKNIETIFFFIMDKCNFLIVCDVNSVVVVFFFNLKVEHNNHIKVIDWSHWSKPNQLNLSKKLHVNWITRNLKLKTKIVKANQC